MENVLLIDPILDAAGTDFNRASSLLQALAGGRTPDEVNSLIKGCVLQYSRENRGPDLMCFLYLICSAFGADLARQAALEFLQTDHDSDEAVIAAADVLSQQSRTEAASLMRRRWAPGRSDAFAIKLADHVSGSGLQASTEHFLREQIRGGRAGLRPRLAKHYHDQREWRSVCELLLPENISSLECEELYHLGRSAVSLFLKDDLQRVAHEMKCREPGGASLAELLDDLWRLRLGEQENGGQGRVARKPDPMDVPYAARRDRDRLGEMRTAPPRVRKPAAPPVNVLGIGAQRTGTSWLWTQLRQCPEVQPLQFKEPVFFSDAFADPSALQGGALLDEHLHEASCAYWSGPTRSLAAYSNLFDETYPLRIDFSPSYCELPKETVATVAGVLGPDVKIILCVRDPVERAWSNLKVDLYPSASAAFEDRISHYTSTASRRRGNYGRIYETWLEYFKQILIISYDDIVENQRKVHGELEAFLDLGPAQMTGRRIVNASSELSLPREDREFLLGLYDEELRNIEELFEGAPRRWRRRHMITLGRNEDLAT